MASGFKVAVVGATGAVGKELLSILEKRIFPVSDLIPFASTRSEGSSVLFRGGKYTCQVMRPGCFQGIDFAFFDASDAVSKEWAFQAAEQGSWVIDNSSTYRLEKDISLVVPEVNGDIVEVRAKKGRESLSVRERVFAGPNCSTVQLVMALKPIRDKWGLKRVVVSTYQSTSGAGAAAMGELSAQTMGVFAQKEVTPKLFPHQIAFNCIPHIGAFKDDGYTSEEQKLMAETKKILNLPNLKIAATAVRVPTFSCHAESVNIECERSAELGEIRAALGSQAGVVVQDEPMKNLYPMGSLGAGQDAVYVGRIRKDPSVEHGLNLWIVSDNLRKGAALNAIQIGEMLIRSRS